MKKETIFRHELNESIQANAAMNCLKNRNKHKQLNEFHPAGLARIALPLLKPVIRKIVANLVSKMGAKAITGSRLIHTVMSKLNAGTIAKVAQKIGETWTEVPEELKQEIWDFAVHTFKELLEKEKAQPQLATQEQEEGADEKSEFALKLVKKFKNRMTPDYAKRPEMFMMLKLQNALKKPLMSLSKEEYRAWVKAICDACESVFGTSQEQEENSLDTEYFSDLEEQEAYYENFRAIAELVADQIDRENGKAIDNNMDTLFEIVREVWNNNPDDLYIWDFDDVQENDCYKFFDKYYETIKNEYLKREHNNIMAATHDDLFAS